VLIPLSIRGGFRKLLSPLAILLDSASVSPNTLTIVGLLPAVLAGIVFAEGRVRLGGILVAVSGLFDLMDGLVAKTANRQTTFGALLDSTVDRYAEIAIFLGLAALFKDTHTLYGVMLAMAGSLMVSYLKARAEGLGSQCDMGVLQRPERLLIIIVGALIGKGALKWAVWLIAIFANSTALERLIRTKWRMGSHSDGNKRMEVGDGKGKSSNYRCW